MYLLVTVVSLRGRQIGNLFSLLCAKQCPMCFTYSLISLIPCHPDGVDGVCLILRKTSEHEDVTKTNWPTTHIKG